MNESEEVPGSSACRALCDIAGYRYGGASCLRTKAVSFSGRQTFRGVVDVHSQIHRSLPDFQVAVIAHGKHVLIYPTHKHVRLMVRMSSQKSCK
jgi:hypothetical protein